MNFQNYSPIKSIPYPMNSALVKISTNKLYTISFNSLGNDPELDWKKYFSDFSAKLI